MNLDHDFFIPDENAQREIADKLNFDYNLGSQDWEYEVSHIRTVEEYIHLYRQENTTAKAQSSLLEMILDSIEDYLDDLEVTKEDKRFSLHLKFIEEAIRTNLDIHNGTIVYWVQGDWKITDFLLEIVIKLNLENRIRWRPYK